MNEHGHHAAPSAPLSETESARLRESEARQAFLLVLGDAMRAQSDASLTIEVAARLLGERLNASRILFAEFDEAKGIADIFHGWFADGARPFPTVMRLEDYDGPILSDLRSGRTVRIEDAGSQSGRPDLAAIAELGVKALLSVPLIVGGRLVVNLSVHQHTARRWTDDEVALVQEVAERLWAELVRARAEAALTASEEKYRSLFDAIDEGLAIVEMIYDEHGEIVDMIFRQVNAAYERQGGIYNVVGRSVAEMLPGVEEIWLDRYRQVARTGQPLRVEDYQQDVGRWFDVYFSRVDEDGRFVAIVFNDISERKRAEAALRESKERQAFLLKLSDALRPLAEPTEIIDAAVQLLGERVRASHTYYAEWPRGADFCEIRCDHAAPDLPSLVGRYPTDAFRFIYDRIRDGRTWVVEDVADGAFVEAERDYCLAHGVAAWIDVPLVKAGELQAALFIVQDAPRRWTATEIALAEETAERTWAAVERARAEGALRESEEKHRTLFETMGQGYAEIELLRDATGRAVDQRYLEFNPAFERLFGIPVAEAKGRKASEVFPVVDPMWTETFETVARTGTPRRIENQHGPPGRWFEAFAYPASGDRVVILYEDVSDRKAAEEQLRHSEERQAFLLKLSDALQQIADAAEIQATTARLVGEHLGVDRAMYAEVDGEPGAETGIIRGQYVRPPAPGAPLVAPFPDRFTYDPFGAHTMAARYRGEPLVVADITISAGFSDAERSAWLTADVRAALVVTLSKHGRLVAEFGIQCATPRAWTDAEVALMREVGERTWAAAERARAEAALRESEEKYRSVFETMDEGFCIWDVVQDADRRVVDLRFVEVNPAFERQTGLSDVVGRLASEVAPETEPEWIDTYGEVARTGAAKRFEMHHAETSRWYDVYASALRGPHGPRVSIVFRDITERKRAEAAERESKERQAFLLNLSDALRAEPDADAMALFALRTLTERLHLDRCYIAEYRLDEDRGDILYQVGKDTVPPLPQSVRLSDFPEALNIARGGTLLIDNIGEAEFLSDVDKRNIKALGMGALVTSATRKGENVPLFAIVAVSATPREWTRGAIALIEEVNERTWGALDRARAEAAMGESEERFRTLAESIADVFYMTDLERGALIYLSPNYEQIWGRPAAELLADLDGFMETIHPDDRAALLAGKAVQERGEPVILEYRIVRPDGTIRWILDRSFPVPGTQGRRSAGVASDITARKHVEASLVESEGRLRTLMEGIPPLVWRSQDEGRWTWASPQWCAFTGQTQEESCGLGWLHALHPDDRERTMEAWGVARPQGMLDVEYRVRRAADGAYLWHHTRSTPVRDADGRILEWLGTTTDIDALKRAEAALRDSEERFRLIVENARDYAIFMTDRDDRVTDWLPGAAAAFGWTAEEAIGHPADFIFTPEDVEAGVPERELEEARRNGVAENVRWHQRKDGARVFIEGSVTALREPTGELRGFLKMGRDATERRRADEALSRSEALFRTLATSIQSLVFLTKPDGARLWGSPQWVEFTGLSLKESIGFGWLDAIHPDDREATLRDWAGALASGSYYAEHRIRRASDGVYRWHQTRARPLNADDGADGEWVGTMTDVDDLRRLQEEQSVLVAELQHRTRNLLAVVRSIAGQTLARSDSLETFKGQYNDRLSALSRVQGLLSRAEREAITVSALLHLELDALGAEGAQERIALDGPEVPLASAVVQTLALALHELATNARKYGALAGDRGRLVVTWRVRETDGGERRLLLEWREQGASPRDPGEPVRRGYGRDLIERALPYALGAKTHFELADGGVRCTIDLPLSLSRTPEPSP